MLLTFLGNLFSPSIRSLIAVVLVTLFSMSATAERCPTKQAAAIVGQAVTINDPSQLLYCEYHFLEPKLKRAKVEYYDEQQQLIALKTVDYSVSDIAPNVEQNDYRNGELRSAIFLPDTHQYRVTYLPQRSDAGALVTTKLKAKENSIVDAGFDNAIRQQWEVLIGGDRAIFAFITPPSQDDFDLQVQLSNASVCEQQRYNKDTAVCFIVKSTSSFLNLFIKPIALIYDKQSQRLLTFSGGVNLVDNDGDSQQATITYRYQ